MADDRSVDMGDSSPTPPAADPPRAVSDLTPVQQAYSDYVTHAVGCEVCRSVEADREPCTVAEVLWETYRQLRRDQQTAARF